MEFGEKFRGIGERAQRVTHKAASAYRERRGLATRDEIVPLGTTESRIIEPVDAYKRNQAIWNEIDDSQKVDFPRWQSTEQEDLNLLLSQYGMQGAANEIHAVLGALQNASEQFSASRTEPLQVEDNSETQKMPRLFWQDAPIRVYAATSLQVEQEMTEIDQSGGLNKVTLLVLADAPKKDQRAYVIRGVVHKALEAYAYNRSQHLANKSDVTRTAELCEEELTLATFPITDVEQRAFSSHEADNIPPLLTRGNYHDIYRIKGRSHDTFYSAFILKPSQDSPELPTLPEVHVYLSCMSKAAIEQTESQHGHNLTCIAEMRQDMLYGRISSGNNGDKGF